MPTNMNQMMRSRRREMAELPPEDEAPAVEVEVRAEKPADSASEGMKVAAPGEPSTGESFEYEPLDGTPGAWVVYPPGVPCDDTAYRVQMSKPAGESDFEKMDVALEAAGAYEAEPEVPMDDEEDVY